MRKNLKSGWPWTLLHCYFFRLFKLKNKRGHKLFLMEKAAKKTYAAK